MTFKSAKLLRLLKTAQMREDSEIMIDFSNMTAWTIHDVGESYQEASLKGYENSIYSTLNHLKELKYIDYDPLSGEAFVTHAGWNATYMTVKAALQFTVKDVIVPIIVAVISAFLTTIALN